MTSINVKMDLIKMDMVVKDIGRLWSEIPSKYTYPKGLLAESRAVFRTDVKKALRIAIKARKVFQEESVLATKYNSISEKIPACGDHARFRNTEYLSALVKGDYVTAQAIFDELVGIAERSCQNVTNLTAELVSSDENGCIIQFSNSGDSPISVMSMSVTSGSEKLKTEPRNTFSVQANSVRKLTVSGTPPFHIALQYTERGENRSFESEMN